MPFTKAKPILEHASPPRHGAFAIENTKAAKVTGCSVTYVSQVTCPDDCPFFRNGCYGESGPVGWNRPDKDMELVADDVINNEAEHIRALSGLRPLRLHIVGDCRTPEQAETLRDASADHTAKEGQPVFNFCHNWRNIPRESWGDISVLASCETTEDALAAMLQGYAAAVVRPEKPAEARAMKHNGIRELPCLHETLGKTCLECQFCMNDQHLLQQRIVIRFTAHGSQRKRVATTVRSLQS